jgi:DNA-binding response OmpR family regulator
MMTILLVDAADTDAAILASALRVEGFDALVRKDADGARQVLASRPVALTIIDLMLRSEGGVNGLELARELRISYPAMRVLLTSSYHLSERQLERADCGVSGFIPKPYDLREVVEFVLAKVSAPPSSRRLWCAEPESGINPRGALLEGERRSAMLEDERAAQRR